MKIYNEGLQNYPEFLTVEEAARYLSVTTQTIYNYIQGDILNAYKLGTKAIRIDKNDSLKCKRWGIHEN